MLPYEHDIRCAGLPVGARLAHDCLGAAVKEAAACAIRAIRRRMSSRTLLMMSLLAILALIAWILRPFLVAVCWAAILAYVSWPLYRHVRRATPGSPNLSALAMTTCLAALIVLPLVGMAVLAEMELVTAYNSIPNGADQAPLQLPAALQDIPWLGGALQAWLTEHTAGPSWLSSLIAEYARRWASELGQIIGGIGRNLLTLLFTLMTAFFFFRDGQELTRQLGAVATRFLGARIIPYLTTGTKMINAVVFGILLAAIAQGAVAALGYWLLGVHAPILLGFATALLSVVPFVGTGFVWVTVGIWLLANGLVWQGLAMFAWGFLLVHPIDNILRPLFISGATRMPLLLTVFGVLGGATAFGLIGIFVGPVILALGLTVWREWLAGAEPLA